MNKLFEVLEKIQDSEAALATIGKAPPDVSASRAFLLNLRSLQKRREVLEEQFLEITKETGLDVCSYRLFPKNEGRIRVSSLANALNDFQGWFSIVFDAIKNGPKERARVDAATAAATAFDFAYSYHGSVGIVLTMPNEQLLFGETELDQAFVAIHEMAKSNSTEQIARFARTFGIAAVRKMYQWAGDHVQSGLGADIQWRRGQSVKSDLFVQAEELEQLQRAIEQSSDEEENTIVVSGMLVGLDVDTRRFHMKTEDDRDIKGDISPIIGTRHTLELPRRYTADILVKRKIYYATEKEDVSYFLLKLQ